MDPLVIPKNRKGLVWLKFTLQDAEGHVALEGSFMESKIPNRYSSYETLMNKFIVFESSNFHKESTSQVWEYALMEEYQSIIRNDVWKFFHDLNEILW